MRLTTLLAGAGLLSGVIAANYTNLSDGALINKPIVMNFADPYLIYDNDTAMYYLTGTTTGTAVELLGAKTLDGLRVNPTRKVIYQDAQMIADKQQWAPSLYKINGTWYAFWANNNWPFAVQGGSDPLGNYSNPVNITEGTIGGIDPSVFELNGKTYMVWSSHISTLVISELLPGPKIDPNDVGTISHPEYVWEYFQGPAPNGINEAPMPFTWNGETYITYSASGCGEATYVLGLLHYTGGDPLSNSSWVKSPNPVFAQGNGNYGPGSNGMFISPDGNELWMAYHATQNPNGDCGSSRATFVKQVDTSNFNATVGPNFGQPVLYGTIYPGPSGEPQKPETIGDILPPGCVDCWGTDQTQQSFSVPEPRRGA